MKTAGVAGVAVLAPLLLSAPTGIHSAMYVHLGGIDQWVTIRGDDDRNPVLLLVHGGPGDVQSPYVATYSPYERDFVLVQWDQRGAGKTYERYGDDTPDLTLARVAQDGIELADYLQQRLPGRPIFLLGHSWGTAIATHMALQRPDLFAAYVGTGQIASWAESAQWQFRFLERKARAAGDTATLRLLQAKPDPLNPDEYFPATRALRSYLDPSDSAWLAGLLDRAKRSPMVDSAYMAAIDNGERFSGRTLLPTQMHELLSTNALRFELPYFVIQGSDDRFVPTEPARAYFEKVVAPHKEMWVIPDAGHFALATHQQEFLEDLRRIEALTGNGGPGG